MNIHSLKRTCPNSTILEDVKIKGFKRIFNKPTPNYAALNVIQTHDVQDVVNGVIVEITTQEDFDAILLREEGYSTITLTINDKKVLIFSSTEEPMLYRYETQRQREYLQTCLNGARERGEKFYNQFLQTTLVEEQSLLKDFYMVKELEEECSNE